MGLLPIYDVRSEIEDALEKCGIAVITAPTGSGKSTQVPKFLLELTGERVLVLQPRRIAARMLAERVACEMKCQPGGLVGYHTRYERAFGKDTRILFVTEGILTRMLADNPALPGVGAIIFDEYHERSLNTDLGLAMAWHSRTTVRNDLLLAVMSATMDAQPVSAFLNNAPVINSCGRLFDVKISYCSQSERMESPADAAASALKELVASGEKGDVLIFMPGVREIRRTVDACSRLAISGELDVMPLYGDLLPEEQRRVMAPSAKRKVIVATNIAETSLTIPGVRHVIDSGLARMARYDVVRGVDVLDTVPIARDSAEQRAGRAGREAPGTCRRLWTWLEHSAKPSGTVPEIHRVDLAEAVLAVHAFGFDCPDHFPWFEKPSEKSLATAEKLLENLGAVKPDFGGISELGRKLQCMPAHPRLALLLWLGCGRGCLELAAWAVGLLSSRTILLPGMSPRRRRRRSELPESEFLELIELAKAAEAGHFAPDYCQSMGINHSAAREIARIAADCRASVNRARWRAGACSSPELAFMQCLLQVFPDRLARRIGSSEMCELPGGRHGELPAGALIEDNGVFVAAEMREGVNGRVQLSMTSAVDEEWLLDLFPDEWQDVDEAFWDERKQQVLRRMELHCLGVKLEEKVRNDPSPEAAAEILADLLSRGKLSPDWDRSAADRWISRVKWLAGVFPERKLDVYSDMMPAYRELCQGETSAKGLKNKDYFSAVKNMLSYEEQRFVDRMAPEVYQLPNGRRMKIEYVPGATPKGRSRIQDFYDLPATPCIAGGRVKILLDILAPNNRTVQITDDLENFWKVLYPRIRTELSRRYPRHLWK